MLLYIRNRTITYIFVKKFWKEKVKDIGDSMGMQTKLDQQRKIEEILSGISRESGKRKENYQQYINCKKKNFELFKYVHVDIIFFYLSTLKLYCISIIFTKFWHNYHVQSSHNG